VLFRSFSNIITLALVLWLDIKIICSNYDRVAQVSYSCHYIHYPSDVNIVIKWATFLEWNTQCSKTDMKPRNVRCDILCDIDMIFWYVFSAMKTVGLVSKVYVLRNYWPEWTSYCYLYSSVFLSHVTCLQCSLWTDKSLLFLILHVLNHICL